MKKRHSRRDADFKPLLPMNTLMPYLMPRRCDSVVYFDIKVDMEKAIEFVRECNESGKYGCKVTYMHILLASLVQLLRTRPHLNSYIMNGRMYCRKHIDIALAVKKQMTEEAAETASKIRFDDCRSFDDIVSATYRKVSAAKGDDSSDNDKLYEFFAAMPGFVLKAVIGFLRFLDKIDKLPQDLYDADPMHSSAFISNLGSIGLGAPLHHLYEWGNCSLFAAMGVIQKEPIVDKNGELAVGSVSHVIVTVDERIAEGMKFAGDLNMFKKYMEDPYLLLEDESYAAIC